ncbi:MAG: ABC transporter ATP-binding protein [Solirubrobacteraceae bacterium]
MTTEASPRDDTAPVLELDGITAGYGGAPVISEVSLRARAAEITAIVGPNGAGKSTLLKALLGIIRASAGSVRLKGTDVTGMATEKLVRSGISYVPQVANVFPSLTVRENLEMGGYCRQAGVEQRLAELCDLFPDLTDALKRTAGTLSGGQRSMLAMARGLMLDPTLLVLDEPSAGLSPMFQGMLWEQITKIAATGVGILVVEQNTRRTLKHADWAYVMVLGRNQLDGPARELAEDKSVIDLYLGRLS